ncbi:MAG: alpha/beta hydrolase [Deltaproteobacteria bacterium]|nr:alpha/beta hydrolase [Deltaproteobacteria bacterium]MBW1846472.1 alpha/beta hydrolase [Deltaproteobacteria bacterium]MBW2179841.1 alpha/beta hydrolase [Deltaproteobacteria bacterium]
MPTIQANSITIEYDTFGDSASPPILLIMGFSGQMILWDEEFCEKLADRGLYVIRFDNRDAGLSSKIEGAGDYDFNKLMDAILQGYKVQVPYTLDDMADDAIGLMDSLNIKKAHVLGTSMGGMIAQVMAIQYPDRLLSLISMSSTTGNPEITAGISEENDFQPVTPMAVPHDREANIEYMVQGMRELAGQGFEFEEDHLRGVAQVSYDRCFYPQGAERQLLAIMVSGNRRPLLEKLTVPALVIHGDADVLVPVEGGVDTAYAIPGAKLLIIEGMGHDLPRGAWPRIIDAITEIAKSADA